MPSRGEPNAASWEQSRGFLHRHLISSVSAAAQACRTALQAPQATVDSDVCTPKERLPTPPTAWQPEARTGCHGARETLLLREQLASWEAKYRAGPGCGRLLWATHDRASGREKRAQSEKLWSFFPEVWVKRPQHDRRWSWTLALRTGCVSQEEAAASGTAGSPPPPHRAGRGPPGSRH